MASRTNRGKKLGRQMSEKCRNKHNNSDGPLTFRRIDGGNNYDGKGSVSLFLLLSANALKVFVCRLFAIASLKSVLIFSILVEV